MDILLQRFLENLAILAIFLLCMFCICMVRLILDLHRQHAFVPLEKSILKSLPIRVFKPEEFKDGLKCVVCLCDVVEGEKVRVLPECNHGFHLDCIDKWFQSHSTCPLCRNLVSNESSIPNSTTNAQEINVSIC
ncbi:unnamed protein product [Vicia faba]|uniref:RING-type domain-containing protein n=1 Tax=Vicia faba TaxID=3906 RepID=A0AAV1AE28_VICFA|nr:unnamed protein product [Vicia faba]